MLKKLSTNSYNRVVILRAKGIPYCPLCKPVYSASLNTNRQLTSTSLTITANEEQSKKSFFTNYFTTDESSEIQFSSKTSTSLSSKVLGPMIDEALKKKDGSSLDMLLDQCLKTGQDAGNYADKIIRNRFMKGGKQSAESADAAARSIQRCAIANIKLSTVLCQHVLSTLVDNCQWYQAHFMCLYMIKNDMSFVPSYSAAQTSTSAAAVPKTLTSELITPSAEKAIFFTLGALMRDAVGMKKALLLLTAIAEHRRTDLAMHFSYTRVVAFFSFLRTNAKNESLEKVYKNLPKKELEVALNAYVSALRQDGWFSFPTAKTLLALAVGSRHQELSIKFIKDCVAAAMDVNNRWAKEAALMDDLSMPKSIDMLSLIRGLAQGDQKAEDSNAEQSARATQPQVTLLLLNILMQQSSVSTFGPLKMMDLCSAHWTLAYRSRFAHLQLYNDEASNQSTKSTRRKIKYSTDFTGGVPIHVLNEVDAITQQAYEKLTAFLLDKEKKSMEFANTTPSERRLLRVLCDQLNIRHRLHQSKEHLEKFSLKVSKKSSAGSYVETPSLSELLRWDFRKGNLRNEGYEHRRLDGNPLYWRYMRSKLLALDDFTLSMLVLKIMNGMVNFPSVHWALLWVEVLIERDLPLPLGTIHSLMRMAFLRRDLYGMIEILLIGHQESFRAKSPSFKSKKEAVQQQWMENSFPNEFDHASDGKRSVESNSNAVRDADCLSRSDWKVVGSLALRSRMELPRESYVETFTEIMTLMQLAGVEMDSISLETLLRFLVHIECVEKNPPQEIGAGNREDRDDDESNSATLQRVIHKLNTDKALRITHVECVAVTALLLKLRLQSEFRLVFLSNPIYKQENFLFVFSSTTDKVVELLVSQASFLGTEFLAAFAEKWRKLNTVAGRDDLFIFISDLLLDPKRRQRLCEIGASKRSGVEMFVQVCIYVAYLIGARDGDYRSAFDMLCSLNALFLQIEREEVNLARKGGFLSKKLATTLSEDEEYEEEYKEQEDAEYDYMDDGDDGNDFEGVPSKRSDHSGSQTSRSSEVGTGEARSTIPSSNSSY